MVSALEWVLVGIVAYAAVVMALRARGILPDYVKGWGPIVTLHTRRGKRFLDWLARPKRLWRAWGNLGVGIALVVMLGTLVLVVFSAYMSLINPPQPTALTEPRNILVIPGVNEFLPLSAAPELVAGLVIALVVHEGGHGLFCRVGDIEIDSMGLAFLSFIPVGAFVGPDEESVARADRGDQTRMFAAGVTNNFAIGLLAAVLLFGPVVASVSMVAGVPVGDSLPGSPADRAGIDGGDVITSVDGGPVANASEFGAALPAESAVTVGLRDGESTTVERRVFVTGVAPDGPLNRGDTITAVNGTTVRTETAFTDAIRNRSVAVLSRANASDATVAIGARVAVSENGSFAAAGGPPGDVVVVTEVGGERIVTAADLQAALDRAAPGDERRIVARVDGEREEYTVELGRGADDEDAMLGVGVYSGVNGITVTDLGLDVYPANTFLDALGAGGFGSVSSFLLGVVTLIYLPFAGIVGGLGYNFPGFNGIATNFYTIEGPLALLGTGGGFLVANVLFWTAWVNLLVGQFNLFPTYPLDGGHIVRTITEAVVSRLPVEDGRRVTTAVTLATSAIVLGAMAMLFIGPQLLS